MTDVQASIESARAPTTVDQARAFAFELIRSHTAGTILSAADILEQHPEFREHKSVVIDLAFEEYTQRVEAGENIVPSEFAHRFGSIQESLQHLLQVNQFLHENSLLSSVTSLADWPESGQEFLNFQLIEELGRGAFSRVFMATETTLGDRPVVVKVCLRGGHEAKTLGKLRHANIVPVHSVLEDERTGLTAICMPFLSRATMLDLLDAAADDSRRPWGRTILDTVGRVNQSESFISNGDRVANAVSRGSYVDGIVSLGIQLADALSYTHSQGICHGDLKPSNVLITDDGNALLIDFNLSFLQNIDRQNVGGTIPYMAPELLRVISGDCRADKTQLDVRTDLYAMGATLYELLSGRVPFEVLTSREPREQIARDLLDKQRHGPRPLCSIDSSIGQNLSKMIGCCLAYDAADRPESAAEIADALRAHLRVVRRVRRWISGHKRISCGFLFIAVLTCGLAAYAVHEPYSDKEYRLGTEAQQQDNLKEAARHLENSLAAAPNLKATSALTEVRLQQGWDAQRRGKSRDAVAFFNKALSADPNCVEALFARGRSYLQSGNTDQAYEDFKATTEKTHDGRASAFMAYYMNLANNHFEDAIPLYEAAIDQGFESAGVYNNLGYSYLHRGKFDRAETALHEAIRRDESLQSAYHNLAIVDWRMSMQNAKRLPDTSQIEAAIGIGPKSALLYLHAANIYAVAAKKSSLQPAIEAVLVDKVMAACSRAVDLGIAPNRLKSAASYYPRLRSLDTFQELVDSPAPENPAIDPRRIVDPLLGMDDAVRFPNDPAN